MLQRILLLLGVLCSISQAEAQISFHKSPEVNYFLGDTFARSSEYLRILPTADMIVKAIKDGKRKKNFPSQEEEDRIVTRIDHAPEGHEFSSQDYKDLARVLGKSIYEHNDYLGLRFRAGAFKKGFADGLANTSRYTVTERRKIGSKLAEKAFVAETERLQRIARENLISGEDFLEKNKSKKGIKTLDSGLQYEIVEAGSGPSPVRSSKITVHYEGKLLDGTVFDSSYEREQPVRFPLRDMINGWREALPLMKEGATWRLFIPPSMAYGKEGYPGLIPSNATLVFKIELLKVE